eukprot:XP_001703029.1 predicted protein [Chlamydomonas reinhardtii]
MRLAYCRDRDCGSGLRGGVALPLVNASNAAWTSGALTPAALPPAAAVVDAASKQREAAEQAHAAATAAMQAQQRAQLKVSRLSPQAQQRIALVDAVAVTSAFGPKSLYRDVILPLFTAPLFNAVELVVNSGSITSRYRLLGLNAQVVAPRVISWICKV